jgi:hypothetical protein
MRPRKVRVMTLSGQMIYTVAPHPDKQSLSAPARRHCEIVSNRSSGSRPGFHIDSHMPISCAFRIHHQWRIKFCIYLRFIPVSYCTCPRYLHPSKLNSIPRPDADTVLGLF